VWQAIAGRKEGEPIVSSVHAQEFPEAVPLAQDADLLARWDRLFEVREEVLKALEIVRTAGTIGNGLEAEVVLDAPRELGALLERHLGDLATVFIVSRARLGRIAQPTWESPRLAGLRIEVRRAPGTKCERCWMVTEDRGSDASWPTLCGRCASVLGVLAARGAGG
jgi:isoleucyl-tRNA synthetase